MASNTIVERRFTMAYLNYIWLGIAIILVAIEAATFNLTTIWMAVSALVCFLLDIAGVSFIIQLIVFFGLSAVLVLFTKPFVMKYLKIGKEKTNVNAIIGREGTVIEEINNLHPTGLVKISGQTWTARSIADDQIIAVDSIVIVERIEGVKVIVSNTNKI